MKQSITILLAFLILSISVNDLAIYVAFKVNQNYIAQNLCVNIDKPQLECHGKCVLEKELKANKEQKDSFPATNPDNKQLSSYLNAFIFVHDFSPPKEDVQLPLYIGFSCLASLSSVFHPPQVM